LFALHPAIGRASQRRNCLAGPTSRGRAHCLMSPWRRFPTAAWRDSGVRDWERRSRVPVPASQMSRASVAQGLHRPFERGTLEHIQAAIQLVAQRAAAAAAARSVSDAGGVATRGANRRSGRAGSIDPASPASAHHATAAASSCNRDASPLSRAPACLSCRSICCAWRCKLVHPRRQITLLLGQRLRPRSADSYDSDERLDEPFDAPDADPVRAPRARAASSVRGAGDHVPP